MKRLSFFLPFLFLAHFAIAMEYSGKVIAIADGDTFTFLTADKRQIKVRLAEIDTPERAQPFDARARQALADLIFAQKVRVVEADTDRYGRLVGHVYVGDLHVNRQLVREGMAWVYRQYMKDSTLLLDEQEARAAKRGLWYLPNTEQVPPWEWRKGVKAKDEPSSGKQRKALQGFTCEGKSRCSEMTSCEEAVFYLNECGVSSLDRDKDGIPCESLCK